MAISSYTFCLGLFAKIITKNRYQKYRTYWSVKSCATGSGPILYDIISSWLRSKTMLMTLTVKLFHTEVHLSINQLFPIQILLYISKSFQSVLLKVFDLIQISKSTNVRFYESPQANFDLSSLKIGLDMYKSILSNVFQVSYSGVFVITNFRRTFRTLSHNSKCVSTSSSCT